MYKSKLQNLCQLRQWPLPIYASLKNGPDHNPTFSATVTVNGLPFSTTMDSIRNSKEAQNNAAKIAFENLSENVHDSHAGLIGGSSTRVDGSPTEVTSKKFIDSAHVYKNRLQSYAVKRNLQIPVYSCEREGSPHAPRFRCKVTFEGKTTEVSEFYSTIKEAEHAAAKNAWESWSLDDVSQDDTVLYKNLLQVYLQKKGCPLPKYETTMSGPSHMPYFVSKVNIKGLVFKGQVTLSKKQAESHVAKVAYLGLQNQELNQAGNTMLCIGQPIETRSGFSSGVLKEPLEVPSSIPQAVMAKADVPPMKLTPYANLLIPTEITEESAVSNMTEELNEAGNSMFCIEQHIETQPEEVNEAGNSKHCIRQQMETQPEFSSDHPIIEALEVSSSILQSFIAKADNLPVKMTPYANLLIPAEISEEYTECLANTDEAPPLSSGTENSAKRLRLCSQDLFDSNSSALSSIESNNVHLQIGSTHSKTSTNETIVVRPVIPNITSPAGTCTFPFSDKKWVAENMNSKK